MSTIKLVARGDNGYRCSCCGRSWKIEQEFNTVEELLKYCIEEKKRAESFGDGFEAQSIYVIEINEDLRESPETVNEDPYGDGWLIKVKITDLSDLEDLMDADEYAELLAHEKE